MPPSAACDHDTWRIWPMPRRPAPLRPLGRARNDEPRTALPEKRRLPGTRPGSRCWGRAEASPSVSRVLLPALRGVERHPSARLRRNLAAALRLDVLAVVLQGLSARGPRRGAGDDRLRDHELDAVGRPSGLNVHRDVVRSVRHLECRPARDADGNGVEADGVRSALNVPVTLSAQPNEPPLSDTVLVPLNVLSALTMTVKSCFHTLLN